MLFISLIFAEFFGSKDILELSEKISDVAIKFDKIAKLDPSNVEYIDKNVKNLKQVVGEVNEYFNPRGVWEKESNSIIFNEY